MSTDLKLRYTSSNEPLENPSDLLRVRAGSAAILLECTKCGWMSQPFMFKARTVHLTARTHFVGLIVDGKIKSWHCKQAG